MFTSVHVQKENKIKVCTCTEENNVLGASSAWNINYEVENIMQIIISAYEDNKNALIRST